jgi:hypothetical protein
MWYTITNTVQTRRVGTGSPVVNWILRTGFWADTGLWFDNQLWKD